MNSKTPKKERNQMPESTLYTEVSSRVYKKRAELGWTQKQMAKAMGISKNHYGDLERGKKKLTVDRLVQIHEITGADLTWLLTGEGFSRYFPMEAFETSDPDREEMINNVLEKLKTLY